MRWTYRKGEARSKSLGLTPLFRTSERLYQKAVTRATMPSTTPTLSAPPASRRAALTNTLIVAGGYLLSRVLGLLRDIIISYQYGTQPQLDAFRATFGIIDLIYIVIAGGALGTAFIPVFAGFLSQGRQPDAERLASAVFRLVLVGLIIACTLIAIFAEPLVALTVGRGFDAAGRALTVQLLRLMLLQPVLLGIGGLTKAILESFDRFALPAIGSNLYNLGIIGGALLAPWLGIYGLAWGVNIGAALFLLVQLPGVRRTGLHLSLLAPIRQTAGLAEVGRLFGPRVFGQAVWQINLIAIASFASLLGEGAVAANGYALQLMLLPHGLIALSLGTVIFPQLSRLYGEGAFETLRTTALGALRTVLFLAIPASLLLGLLGLPLVRLLFQRGAFDQTSAALTTGALTFYMFGLAAFAGSEILVRTSYAMHDTRTPVVIGAIAVATNIALAYAFVQYGAGLEGLALAFSISSTLEAALLLVMLRRKLGAFGASFWRALLIMLAAALVAGAVLFALRNWSLGLLPYLAVAGVYHWPADFLPLAAWMLLAGTLATLIYGGITVALGLDEPRAVLRRIRRRRREDSG